jgi:hypothetical protein
VGGVAALALIAGVLLFLRRRKAKTSAVAVEGGIGRGNEGDKAQYEAKTQAEWASYPPPYQTPQLPSDEIQVEGPVRPVRPVHEMSVPPAELPGTAVHGGMM